MRHTVHRTDAIARRGRAGFTLIEVLTALAVLGTAVFVLMDAHYFALNLFTMTEEEVDFQQLFEEAVAQAELGVYSQLYTDSGDFGARYPGYTYQFEATPVSSDYSMMDPNESASANSLSDQDGTGPGLYEVSVSVNGPDSQSRSLTFYIYDTGLLDQGPEGLSQDNATRSTMSGSRSSGGLGRR